MPRPALGDRLLPAASVLAILLALMIVREVQSRGAEPPVERLLAKASEYVRRFEHDFAFVVSDESYHQQVAERYPAVVDDKPITPAWSEPANARTVWLHRRTRAEMLFLWLPDEAAWLTVRNVVSVDGRAVLGSQRRLEDALRDTGDGPVPRLRRLVDESARFNLGRTFRNYNFPTQVLSYLDAALQPQFRFNLKSRERVSGIDAWKVAYEERATPTVIQGDGADRRSRGIVWVDERDGAIVKTTLGLTIPGKGSLATDSLEVIYARDATLAMWVPVRMLETYVETRGSIVTERLVGDATYSNFRRFETSGRVLEPR